MIFGELDKKSIIWNMTQPDQRKRIAKNIGASSISATARNVPGYGNLLFCHVLTGTNVILNKITINLDTEEVLTVKWYHSKWEWDAKVPIGEAEMIKARFEWYFTFGNPLSEEKWNTILFFAKHHAQSIYMEKYLARERLKVEDKIKYGKVKKRKGLQPMNVRSALFHVLEYLWRYKTTRKAKLEPDETCIFYRTPLEELCYGVA